MTNVSNKNSSFGLSKKEKYIICGILFLISIFTVMDIFEDMLEGAPLKHIIPEFIVVLATATTSTYLFLKFASNRFVRLTQAELNVMKAQTSATEWQNKAKELTLGLSQAITKQLEDWRLTKAEQEIAFLLIKGMSVNEISEIRNTSPQTTRQQSSIIYRKSGLEGRAQLAAFFIEDILVNLDLTKPE